jgi:hypothetical protein
MSPEWDGLRGCEICGEDTTGRLCNSCRRQEMIDNSDFRWEVQEFERIKQWEKDHRDYDQQFYQD